MASNSWMNKYTNCRNMNEARFFWFFLYMIDLRNLDKENKVVNLLCKLLIYSKFYFPQLRWMADPRSARRRSFVADLDTTNLEPEAIMNEQLENSAKPSGTTDDSNAAKKEPFGTNDDGTLSCGFCGKVYKQVGYMRKHLSTLHDVADLSLICQKCLKNFETKKKLTRHEGMKGDCSKL